MAFNTYFKDAFPPDGDASSKSLLPLMVRIPFFSCQVSFFNTAFSYRTALGVLLVNFYCKLRAILIKALQSFSIAYRQGLGMSRLRKPPFLLFNVVGNPRLFVRYCLSRPPININVLLIKPNKTDMTDPSLDDLRDRDVDMTSEKYKFIHRKA